MNTRFPIYALDDLVPLLDRRQVIDVVREALIRHARGEIQSPMPGQLVFDDARGDCHIKYGHMRGSATFVIKVATGFFDNPSKGLPSANGLTLLMDATTGTPRCLFQDGGMLTAWRTAAATALAAQCLCPVADPVVGIVGAGLQAQLTPAWVRELLPEASFVFCSRDEARARQAAERCGAGLARSVEALLAVADVVVTATPSTGPLFGAAQVREGTHFVALGADGPNKQELPTALFARARWILTDDRAQCEAYGDFGKALMAGEVERGCDLPLGAMFGGTFVKRERSDISIADLTGLAAQDIAIADWFGLLL